MTFTTTNWATAQTVTVKAGQDDDGAADTATLTHTASGGDYASVSNILPVTVTDDDTAGVVLSVTDLTVTEGVAAGSSYTVKLVTQPSDVIVTISGRRYGPEPGQDDADAPRTNWDVAQTVTVTAAEDDDGVTDAGVTLTHTVSGDGYGSTTVPDVEVSITENDTAGVTIEPTTLSVVAGRSNEYTGAGHRADGRGHRDRLRPCWHGRDAGQDDADLHLDQLGHRADCHRISYSERRHREGYPGAYRCGVGLRFRHRGAGGRLGSGCCRSAADDSGRGELIDADPDGT